MGFELARGVGCAFRRVIDRPLLLRLINDLAIDIASNESSSERTRAAIFTAFSIEQHEPELAMRLLDQLVRSRSVSSLGHQASTIFYRLGRMLRLAGRTADEAQLYEHAVAHGVWQSPMQRPGYTFSGKQLTATPWPSSPMLGEQGAAAIELLHSRYEQIKREVLTELGLCDDGRAPRVSERQSQLHDDDEQLIDEGRWRKVERA